MNYMGTKKLKAGKFLKMLFIKNNLTPKEVAEKLGKTPENLNGILRNNRMNLGTLTEIMEVCEEPLVLKLTNGEVIEIEVDKKKSS